MVNGYDIGRVVGVVIIVYLFSRLISWFNKRSDKSHTKRKNKFEKEIVKKI
jgi:hypothetical protein